MRFEVESDLQAVAKLAAAQVQLLIEANLKPGARFTMALSGGSTPRAFHRVLAEDYRTTIPWSRVDLCLSDERAVAPGDERSNHHMVQDTLLAPLGTSQPAFYGPKGIAENTSEAAGAYQSKLIELTGSGACDLVMLGMGADGHTASLFPGFEVPSGLIAPVLAPKDNVVRQRISFTYEALSKAKTLMVMVCGASKAEKLAEILDENKDYPLTRVLNENKGNVIIIADRAASVLLKNRPEMK